MDAGKKMDALVAEKLLDWKKESGMPAPAVSTDLSSAWKLVDPICDRGFRLQLSGSRIWQARFYKSVAHTLETRAFEATGSNPAEAICLAALAVNGQTLK
ncbi:MAG: hypothetical protein H7301_09515 [Cryobacterium sp.]|nr:hypothetical protein [Oligoflexia bacterium]